MSRVIVNNVEITIRKEKRVYARENDKKKKKKKETTVIVDGARATITAEINARRVSRLVISAINASVPSAMRRYFSMCEHRHVDPRLFLNARVKSARLDRGLTRNAIRKCRYSIDRKSPPVAHVREFRVKWFKAET